MAALYWISGDSWRRFSISVTSALVVFLLLPHGLSLPTRAITIWDTFAGCGILLAWLAIVITPQESLPGHAQAQDFSRLLIFGFVVTAACVALLAVGFVIRVRPADSHLGITRHIVLGLGTVALSWVLLHTVYSIHYAHVYYGDSDEDRSKDGGLEFPHDDCPDYLDFAYFSFVVGMTCQVSDVQVTSKRMRRLTLLHGVISFAFNTVILALLINTISGLL